MNKNNILDAYKFRYACKDFDLNKKISDEDFNFILETGRLSPSSFGFEPWRFLVVQNMDIRNKLKEYSWGAQRQLPSASHFVVLLARKAVDTSANSKYISDFMENIQKLPSNIIEMKSDFYGNFQKNDFDLTDDRKLFDWASKQVYLPLANMMTSAAQIGIDSCPIEGFNRTEIDKILVNENMMNPDHFSVAAMVAFGYRSEDTRVSEKTRQSKDEMIKWF